MTRDLPPSSQSLDLCKSKRENVKERAFNCLVPSLCPCTGHVSAADAPVSDTRSGLLAPPSVCSCQRFCAWYKLWMDGIATRADLGAVLFLRVRGRESAAQHFLGPGAALFQLAQSSVSKAFVHCDCVLLICRNPQSGCVDMAS